MDTNKHEYNQDLFVREFTAHLAEYIAYKEGEALGKQWVETMTDILKSGPSVLSV